MLRREGRGLCSLQAAGSDLEAGLCTRSPGWSGTPSSPGLRSKAGGAVLVQVLPGDGTPRNRTSASLRTATTRHSEPGFSLALLGLVCLNGLAQAL